MKPIFDPAKLIFLEDDHSYHYEGRQLVSVTQALSMTGFIDSRFFTQESRDRGTYVHEACCLIDDNALRWETLHSDLVPYCKAYTHFLNDTGFKVLHSEMPVAHPAYMYAGTLDRIGELNAALAMIDIKTGAFAAWHALQSAGYSATFEDTFERYSLHLGSDGKYKLVPHKDKSDLRVFLSAVTCSNWQRRSR